jgi:hypothetical protein
MAAGTTSQTHSGRDEDDLRFEPPSSLGAANRTPLTADAPAAAASS